MKNSKSNSFLFAIVLFFLILSNDSIGQSPNFKNALSANVVGIEYYGLFKNDFQKGDFVTTGLKFGYHRNLVDALNLEVPIFIGGAKVPIDPLPNNPLGDISAKTLKFSVGGLLQLQFFKEKNWVVPYFSFGVMASNIADADSGEWHAEIPVGIGLDFKLYKRNYFQIRPEYRLALNNEKRNNLNLNVGLKFMFGSGNSEPVPPSVEEDRDQDGVLNEVDKCPDVPGLPYLRGCPDSDSDGIIDEDDLCPNVLGLAKFGGCPDSDNDGIPDKNDKCPNEAGPIPNGGCPNVDSDGDGVLDNVDECKNLPGLPKFNGCPDSDGDGISDNEDDCPREKGLANLGGCPDSDRDGIINKNDSCPNEAGPKSNRGCPEVVKEVQEAVSLAADNVQFENNSSVIKTSSFSDLDNVANLLQQYPEYNVSISGHTDSTGNENYNKDLSEKRAKACMDYLVSKGVDASRISSAGYGETQSIADNSTEEGRQLNRRVEFKLYKR